ncbi:hypothetical protein [Desulfotalea psychrophila]|uniref:Uncharacterized protein n=1 Tax=Desulfotalea psychrophila (strain LSv54 / DSM 12343) TaxID=177439 RepID=Q6AMU9_DESPS|nr:hypothetical protein [Desulfotalea psychrophila]CAG36325.1 unknown protein [Desulfotalea psychrophila LSv54]
MAIDFDLIAGYEPPAGDEISFAFPYAPPLGDHINFDLEAGYTPPAGDKIYFGGEPTEPPEPQPEPIPLKPYMGKNIPWGAGLARDRRSGAGWSNQRRFLSRSFGLVAGKSRGQDMVQALPWGTTITRDRLKETGWQILREVCCGTSSFYIALFGKDTCRSMPWDSLKPLKVISALAYLAPPPQDLRCSLLFADGFTRLDDAFALPYIPILPVKDASHRTLWGDAYYAAVCVQEYEPPASDSISFDLDEPISLVGDGDHIDFVFDSNSYDERCSQREPSGWRDANTFVPPPTLPTGLSLRTYIMMSSAQLNRKPDDLPIPVKSLSLSLDWDSVHWSLSATVIGGDVRTLSPTKDGPIEVEAMINGTTWACVVDDWSRDQSFGAEGRSIRGRSRSAILGTPWAPRKTEVEDGARTALQLMEAELENSGWTISSTLVDWLLPADTLQKSGATALDTIKRIATAAGGFVRPDTKNKILHIQPKYKVAPWKAKRSDADMVLPASMVVRGNAAWDGREDADAVHIVGGISVAATRAGTAGGTIAPDVTEPLITEVDAARARAIHELGRCGRWQKHSFSLPVFEDAVPGLILPGQIIAVDDDTTWLGFISSVSIKADWGSAGLVVRQEIAVEVYVGD